MLIPRMFNLLVISFLIIQIWKQRLKNYASNVVFITELELIFHLVLLYLWFTWSMLLINKIYSVTQVLKSFTFPWKQDVTWMYISLTNICDKFYVQDDCSFKIKTFLGKVKIIIKQYHLKKTVNELKLRWKKFKKS